MTGPNLQSAAAFLDVHQFSDHATFATATRARIMQTGGLFSAPMSDQSGTWASASAEVNLFGIFAFGETGDQAIRNWRRVATRMIDPSAGLTNTQAIELSMALEALTDPDALVSDKLCRLACETILRLSRNQADRARADALQQQVSAFPMQRAV